MWSLALLTGMLALIMAYGAPAERGDSLRQQELARAGVAEMAVYRAAVARYFGANDKERGSVTMTTLRAQGHLRAWSTLDAGRWDNYRAPDGTIYIYARVLPPVDLSAALLLASRGSLLAGHYRAGSANLISPLNGDTRIPLGRLLEGLQTQQRTLPTGAPVWLAVAE
jgi:hypothetical protein